jgi:predicted CoA-binding protein
MNHDSYPDNYIRGILNSVKSIAMVGASPVNVRPSYFAFKYLAERGYDMIPVNPGHVGKSLLGKAAFYRQAEMNLADAYHYAAEVMTENMMARDAEEGIGAFIEKREPKWQDK